MKLKNIVVLFHLFAIGLISVSLDPGSHLFELKLVDMNIHLAIVPTTPVLNCHISLTNLSNDIIFDTQIFFIFIKAIGLLHN